MRKILALPALIQQKLRYLRFKSKVLILILFSVFVPLFTAMLMFGRYASDTARAYGQEAMRNAFSQAYDVLADRFSLVRQNASLIMIDASARDLIQTRPYNHDFMLQRDMIGKAGMVIDFVENTAAMMNLSVYVPDAYTYIVDNHKYFRISAVAGDDWYASLFSKPYRSMWAASADALSYMVRVCDVLDYSRTVSILRLDFSRGEAETALRQAITYDGSCAYLLSDTGEIVAMASVGQPPPGALPTDGGLDSLSFSEARHVQGDGFHLQYRSFKSHPWTLVMLVPERSPFQILNSAQQRSIYLLAFVCGAAIVIICLVFSQDVISRVQMVSSSMKALENGVLRPLDAPRARDEIGALIESYNYLTEELDMQISARHMAGVSQKNAELRALHSQINPHFLYNTLELINYYAFQNSPEGVEEIVSLLSKFYKLSLNRGEDLYQVWQELELTNIYHRIQNIRYEGRIELRCDVPVALCQCEMPRIVLQPLVENAIYHGIMNRDDKRGRVAIAAERQGSDILFTVADNGIGISAEQAARLNASLGASGDGGGGGGGGAEGGGARARARANDISGTGGAGYAGGISQGEADAGGASAGGTSDSAGADSSTSGGTDNSTSGGARAGRGSRYGVKNIDERLRAYYGEGYGLTFEAAPGGGTVVRLRLPMR
jgi:two-component system sensor histidine kinase YesM